MRRAWVVVVVVVIGATAVACATVAHDRVGTPAARSSCPRGVLAVVSSNALMADVLRAAQRELAKQSWNTQGTVYRLGPRNAPIDFIAALSTTGIPAFDRGVLALHRAAVSDCGERIAQASWAIHYRVIVGITARPEPGNDVYAFFVQTRDGWRFWGRWCDIGTSAKWREANSWCTAQPRAVVVRR